MSVRNRSRQGVKLVGQPAAGAGSERVRNRFAHDSHWSCTLCHTLTVSGLTNVTAAHIHLVSTGAIVVPLTTPTTGTSSGCATVEKSLLQQIVRNPGAYYVNVHTSTFPNGQVQGTLSK